MEQYNQQCNEIETELNDETKRELQTTYGITTRNLLSTLPTFNITKQLPQDFMHILLEGSVQYEVRYILQHFIANGDITFKQSNNTFTQTSIGYQDERNRPPPLRETVFDGSEIYKLIQSAEQARIFLKHLPFVLTGFINYENPF